MLKLNIFSTQTNTINNLFKNISRYLLIFIVFITCINQVCLAQQTSIITLPILDEGLERGLTLKHVHAYRQIFFMKPKTWKIMPGSTLNVKFQHSQELLPNRSYINIFINKKLVKKESLDKSSLELKNISIPLPVSSLGDYNTLDFEVVQHYTDICEDPLDHSLWTYVHPETNITYKYTIQAPNVDLSKYPFPLYDPYTYETNEISFIMPKLTENSELILNAIGIISADIAQKIGWHKLKYDANENINNNLNTVIIGTPSDNKVLQKLNSSIGNIIKNSGGTSIVTDAKGNKLDDNTGIIFFINNPQNKSRAMLIITGNTATAVNNAARYLANETLAKKLKGKSILVKDYNPPKETPDNIAKYIHNKSLTLKELGFNDRKSVRIGPPPLVYPIRIMPDMSTSNGNVSVDLIYSYSPKLNDELSTMEVVFNGISLGAVKLDNPNGEKDKTLKVDVPYQYVKTYNEMAVYFHLYPYKVDYCKNYFDDDLWGIVSKNSMINIPSDARVIFPNLGLLNDAMYPYTTQQDLSNTAIILPDNPTIQDYQAMLNTIGGIAKLTNSDAGINIITLTAKSTNNINDRNIILIGKFGSNTFMENIKNYLYMTFDNYSKLFAPELKDVSKLNYFNDQGIIEQIISNLNADKVITVVYGKTNEAVKVASTVFTEKNKLISIQKGNLCTLDKQNIKNITIYNPKKVEKSVSTKKASKESSFWPFTGIWDQIFKIILCVIIILAILWLINYIIRSLFSKEG